MSSRFDSKFSCLCRCLCGGYVSAEVGDVDHRVGASDVYTSGPEPWTTMASQTRMQNQLGKTENLVDPRSIVNMNM